MDEREKYLYTLHTNPTVMCQLRIFRIDRTRPIDGNGRLQIQTALSDRTYSRVRSGVTGHVLSFKIFSGTSLFHFYGQPDTL
jgi:hypothetical protein